MFQTIGYKGHYIQTSHNVTSRIQAQIMAPDGGFKLIDVRSIQAAKILINQYISNQK